VIDDVRRLRRSLRALAKTCPHMAAAIERDGFPEPRNRDPGFATLLNIIVCQQVSKEAGASIWGKLEKRLGEVTPEKVGRVREGTLRACGLSRPKVRYAKALAREVASGALDLAGLAESSDEEIMKALTAVTGIGAWTAEIYMMFGLGRPDIMPGGDLALAVAAGRLLGLDERPSPDELVRLAERWRPHRTAAAIMLWHVYRRAPIGD
jgi:DNA-3-methyladenine glycosylase II